MSKSVAVVGAGVFGVTAALELAGRGWKVLLIDPGPLPHPLAASTDISKMIRADYGTDEHYVDLMEKAFPIWREWNGRWGVDLYHETGFLILAAGGMEAGGFEQASYATLVRRGFPLQELDAAAIAARFPAWTLPPGRRGYLNPTAGWAESGEVMGRLLGWARTAGVDLAPATVTGLLADGSRVLGVVTGAGERIECDLTVVAAGAWTAGLVPGLDGLITTTGQPVVHFRPDRPERFRPPEFPPWAADIGNTGWYGFPARDDGIVKVSNHGRGRRLGPDEHRQVDAAWEGIFRAFLSEWIPSLAGAPIVADRLCLYTDTTDGDFLIDRHPDLERLVVATGGSGHGFKFAPVLGTLVADAAEERDGPLAGRFRWRSSPTPRVEAARATGAGPGAAI